MRVHSLVQEESLKEEMVTHSSIFDGIIQWTEEPGWIILHGIAKSQT